MACRVNGGRDSLALSVYALEHKHELKKKMKSSDSKRSKKRYEEYTRKMKNTSTLYVGNLSFYTTEEQIMAFFSRAGDVKDIKMGHHKTKQTPCGFCFVIYENRGDAENCMRYLNGTRLDDRIIRTDWDSGFSEGRQFGFGESGGQKRDEYREDYDSGRGGFGQIVTQMATTSRNNHLSVNK